MTAVEPNVWQVLSGRYAELVISMVREAGPLYKTAVAKLTYLTDLEHFARAGRSMTGADYRRQEKGPLAVNLFSCNALDRHELSIARGPFGGIVFGPGPAPRFAPGLSEAEHRVLRDVLASFPDPNDIDRLLAAAYATPPMRRVLAEEERTGRKLLGESLEFRPGDRFLR